MAKVFRKTVAMLCLLLSISWLVVSQNPISANSHGKIKPQDKKDAKKLAKRGDIKSLPQPLKDVLIALATFPTSYGPAPVYNEFSFTKKDGLLFQYYLLDPNGFEPTVFTKRVPGFTDTIAIGAVRMILEPEPDRPYDSNDVRSRVTVYSDLGGLITSNNESGWYEGWLMHDIVVPAVDAARADGSAQFGKITSQDADKLKAMGAGNNVPGKLFTLDGNAPRFPSAADRFPDVQSNVLPVQVSAGVFNSIGETDAHTYKQLTNANNWTYPTYELPYTGGLPKIFAGNKVGAVPVIAPVDDPLNPRDADNTGDPASGAGGEARNRFIPSGLAREIMLDAFVRLASFEPNVTDPTRRVLDAYTKEVAKVDKNSDGFISFDEADPNGTSDGLPNTRLYIPVPSFNRYAISQEINDGLLAPRFAPSQRAFVLSGTAVQVNPAVVGALPDQAGDSQGIAAE